MGRVICCLPVCMLVSCTLAPETSSPPETAPVLTATIPAPPGPESPPIDIEHLVRTDPLAFLHRAIARCDREVHAYRTTLLKQERLAGKLGGVERIDVCFRQKPFSVRMDWKDGPSLVRKALYVAGENNGHILVQPAGWRSLAGIVRCDPAGPDAKSGSRYPINEFGFKHSLENTLLAWKAGRDQDDFRITFQGEKKLPELNHRPAWELRRIERPCDPDRLVETVFYFDTRTWLQVGSILRDDQGRLVGRYFFSDVQINPTFPAGTFTRDGLKK